MLVAQLLKLSDDLAMAREREIRLDPLRERGEPDLLEPLDRGLRE